MTALLTLLASTVAHARESSLGALVDTLGEKPGEALGYLLLIVVLNGLIYFAARRTAVRVRARALPAAPRPTDDSLPPEPSTPKSALVIDLVALRVSAPEFSEGAFLRWARELFGRAQAARVGPREELLRAEMSAAALEVLFADSRGLDEVNNLIPTRTRILRTVASPDFATVVVGFESILTEVGAAFAREIAREERWTFVRMLDQDQRPHWIVQEISRVRVAPLEIPAPGHDRGPLQPGRAPLFDPHLQEQVALFEAAHPDHSWQNFALGARAVFARVQDAISRQDPEPMERFVTEQGHDEVAGYVYPYNAKRLARFKKDAEIDSVDVVRVGLDEHFEVVTVRLQGTLRDWVEDGKGRLYAGDPDGRRPFVEYWTFERPTDGSGDWRLRQLDTDDSYLG